jgi:hypothetical protein
VLIGGSSAIVQGLFYYLPAARPIEDPPSPEGQSSAPIAARVMVCVEGDASCRAAAASFVGNSGSVSDVTLARTFLGFSSPPRTYRIVVARGAASP